MLESVSRYVKRLRRRPRALSLEEENLKPYTMEELMERAEKGRREIAQGNYVTSEEVFRDLFVKSWTSGTPVANRRNRPNR